MAEFKDLLSEYTRRIAFLLQRIPSRRRLEVLVELLEGNRASESLKQHIEDRLEFYPHGRDLYKLETRLAEYEDWPAAQRQAAASLLRSVLDNIVAERVAERLTQPVWGVFGPTKLDGDEGELEIHLADTVPAPNLRSLLVTLDTAYKIFAWSDQLYGYDDPTSVPALNEFVPRQILMVAELHIGTPNRLKIRGKLRYVVQVATLLTTVLGAPIAATEAYKNYAEAEKNFAEARKLRLEETISTLDVIERAKKMRAEGKLSEQAYEQLLAGIDEIANEMPASAPILKPQQLNPERPPSKGSVQ